MAVKLTFPQAIAREEGFYAHGTRAARNHNPGNLEYGPFAHEHGAIGTDGRFAIFQNDEAGFAALAALLSQPSYSGSTIREAIQHFAPANENDTSDYITNVCAWTQTAPTDLVGQCL